MHLKSSNTIRAAGGIKTRGDVSRVLSTLSTIIRGVRFNSSNLCV